MAHIGSFLIEIDTHSFVLELRDKLCDIHGMDYHQISLVPSGGYRPLNMFDQLNDLKVKKENESNERNGNSRHNTFQVELILYPTNKTCFSNDFWAYYVSRTISKQQFIDHMNKKIIYLELSRGGRTPPNIVTIKQKLTEKKVKPTKYELNEFVLWNDVRVMKLFNNNSMRKCLNQLKWEMDYALQRDTDYSVYYPLNEDAQRDTNLYVESLLKKIPFPSAIIKIIIQMIENGFRTDARNGKIMVKVYGNWSKCTLQFPST
eukprot:308432_1